MAINKGIIPGQAAEHRLDFKEFHKFLAKRQYEKLAALLLQLQIICRQNEDRVLADILTAAHRICLACNQCRNEAASLDRACAAAEKREYELKHELQDILNVISDGRPPEKGQNPAALPVITSLNLPSPSPPKLRKQDNLWQHIKNLLGWSKTFRVPKREAPTESSAGLVDAAGAVIKMPVDFALENSTKVLAASPVEQKEQYDQGSLSLIVYCLGPLRVYNNDKLIKKWPGQKCKSLFKYMIVNREQPIHQEILMGLFWADAVPHIARRNLYQAIYSLRQVLQSDGVDVLHVVCEDNCYCLNPELDIWVDSETFVDQYQIGQKLACQGCRAEAVAAYEAAESLYADDFLMEDLYEDWLLVHRENLKHAYLDILEQLSRYYFEQQQWAICINFCQKILVKDNCREDAHRRLMRCYMYQGQRHLALRQYHLCVDALERELDVPPMPATMKLCQKIRQNKVQNSSSPKLKRS